MRVLIYIFFLLLMLLGLTLAGLNTEPVVLHYYVGSIRSPLSLLIALSFTTGGLLGLLAALIIYIKLKAAQLRLRQRLKVVEQELVNLRALPLND